MKKIPIILAVLFFCSTLFLIYAFVFRGRVVKSDDHRIAIQLSKENKDFALKEMRSFLVSVQQINEGIIYKDADAVYKAAKESGGNAVNHAPKGIMASLPIEFKKLGFSVHDQFDIIADSILKYKNFNTTHRQLNTMLKSCIVCHNTFKFVDESKNSN